MRNWIIAAALSAAALGGRPAQARMLTLSDAVELAFRVDPTLGQARILDDRTKLGVLRSQLDRVSLRIDGQLQELWNKSNIGGPAMSPLCSFDTPFGPFATTSLGGTDCTGRMGTLIDREQSPENGQGLFNLTANLNVPIFSGLRVESNVRRTQRLHDAALANVRQARRDVALAVGRAYWSVRRLGLMLDVQREAVARLREGEEVVAARVKVGLAPPIDQNRATLRRLQQEVQLADLQGQLREATAQLAVALGLGSEELILVDEPNFPSAKPAAQDDLVAEARRGRPELQNVRNQILAQRAVVRMAQSAYYPQLNGFMLMQFGNNPLIVGQGARAASDAVNPFANISGNLTFGATLSMNFFDMMNTYTTVKDQRYEEARLVEEGRRAERAIDSEVRVAEARVERLAGRRAPLLSSSDIAKDNLGILLNRYKNGDALVIELLDAQVDRVNTQLQLTDVTAQLQLAWLELDAALGQTIGVRK